MFGGSKHLDNIENILSIDLSYDRNTGDPKMVMTNPPPSQRRPAITSGGRKIEPTLGDVLPSDFFNEIDQKLNARNLNESKFILEKEFPVSIEQAKKQAISDLLFAPISLGPIVLGATAGMVGWANSGPTWLFMAAVGGILGTLGIISSRLIFGFEGMVDRAFKGIQEKERHKKRTDLMILYDKLANDGDGRDNKALTQLVEFYSEFNKSVRNSPISIAGKTNICEKVDKLFEGCVKTLEHQYNLLQAQNTLTGVARSRVKEQREQELNDVVKSVDQLGIILNQCLEMSKESRNEASVSSLSDELEATMAAAKQTQQRMASVRENELRV